MEPWLTKRGIAHCPDLPAILAAYPPDKRITVAVPLSAFDDAVAQGDEVRVGNGHDVVSGRVKRLMVEVEVDLATLQEAANADQGGLW